MGLLKATLIAIIMYFVFGFAKSAWLDKTSPEFSARVTPWLMIGIVFIIETLL